MRAVFSVIMVLVLVPADGSVSDSKDGAKDELSAASLQLLEVAYTGDEIGVLQALANDADIDAKASYKFLKSSEYNGPLSRHAFDDTAIVLAVEEEHVRIVEILLKHGADPSEMAGGVVPDSVLEIAVSFENVKVARLLLKHGADPNEESGGYRVLGTAVRSGNLEMVRVLLEHGGDPNAGNGFGNTALHEAATDGGLDAVPNFLDFLFGRYSKIMRLLLSRGADPNIRSNLGKTPLMKSADFGFTKGVDGETLGT